MIKDIPELINDTFKVIMISTIHEALKYALVDNNLEIKNYSDIRC